MSAPFLEVKNVSHAYSLKGSSIEAVEDISIGMRKGEVLSIVGASGCGKSTLLKIISGITEPTKGEILFEGIPQGQRRRIQDVGFAFQKASLFPWRTVLQNILLPVEIKSKKTLKHYIGYAHELIEILGLSGFEGSYPRELSGGMLQRASLARALVVRPKLLLLDEPFSALDEITRESLWIDFNSIWKDCEVSVVLVTHSIREAVFLSDRVCVMSPRPGRIMKEFHAFPFLEAHRDTLFRKDFLELCKEIRSHL